MKRLILALVALSVFSGTAVVFAQEKAETKQEQKKKRGKKKKTEQKEEKKG